MDRTNVQYNSNYAWVIWPILTLALVLRVIGIDFGLPMAYHPDEPILVMATKQFFSGDFNPHNFYYPSLLMYTMHAVERVYYLFATGPVDNYTLYLLSRLTVVGFSLATIFLLFIIGKRMRNVTTGLVAALILSLIPLHLIHSHFATTDVPLAFFVLLTLLYTGKLAKEGSTKLYILTGLFFGLTVSMKVPGAMVFFSILYAHFIYHKRKSEMSYVKELSEDLHQGWIHCRNITLAMLAGLAIYFIFKNTANISSTVLRILPVEIWAKYYDEIVSKMQSTALKFALVGTLVILVILYTKRVWRPQFKYLLLLVFTALATFLLTTPYAILDYRAFLSDFFHQVIVSQTTWSGMFANSESAYSFHLMRLFRAVTPIPIILAGLGALYFMRKRSLEMIIILIFVFVYYLYIGSWKLMFDRYLVPMLPIVALLSAFGFTVLLQKVLELTRKLNKNAKNILRAAYVLSILGIPVFIHFRNSVIYDQYLLKKSTRQMAYEWAISHLPSDAKVLREQYAPEVELDGFVVENVRYDFADSVSSYYILEHQIDYIIVTDKLWKRPIQENGLLGSRTAYKKIAEYADLIYQIKPLPEHPGPEIKIFKVRIQTDSVE